MILTFIVVIESACEMASRTILPVLLVCCIYCWPSKWRSALLQSPTFTRQFHNLQANIRFLTYFAKAFFNLEKMFRIPLDLIDYAAKQFNPMVNKLIPNFAGNWFFQCFKLNMVKFNDLGRLNINQMFVMLI